MAATWKKAAVLGSAGLAVGIESACATLREKFGRSKLSSCERAVLILTPPEVHRQHARLAPISTSCVQARECDRHLRKRACELHADAVIVQSSGLTGDPLGPQLGSDGRPLNGSNGSIQRDAAGTRTDPGGRPSMHV